MIALSEFQKYQIITILRDLASIDREFDLLEAVRIRLIGLKMDLHAAKIDEAMAEDIENLESVKKRLDAFQAEEQKKFLYQQCVLLLLTNRETTPEEIKAMEEIRQTLSLDKDFHQRISDWAKEGIDWEKRGEEMVGGEIA